MKFCPFHSYNDENMNSLLLVVSEVIDELNGNTSSVLVTVTYLPVAFCFYQPIWPGHQWADCSISLSRTGHARSHGPLDRYIKLRVRMRRECREHFPRVSDRDMHHGTCVTHMPWCMPESLTSGIFWKSAVGENVPGIPGACTTRNFTYLVRGPWYGVINMSHNSPCFSCSTKTC